ncbi:MAG: hypothetical protein ACTH3E_10675 [Psychroflexus halocasei]
MKLISKTIYSLCLITLCLLTSCQTTTSDQAKNNDLKSSENNLNFNHLAYGPNKDSLRFIINKDTFQLSKKYVYKVLDSFPSFKIPHAKHPDTLLYNSKKSYHYAEAQTDGVHLVYACVQNEINDTNSNYEEILNIQIKLYKDYIKFSYSKLNKGTYFTHLRSRLYAKSVYQARIDQNSNYLKKISQTKKKQELFDRLRVKSLNYFNEHIPYFYKESKAEEEQLRQEMLENIKALKLYVDTDYKLKHFEAIYF